MLNVRHTASMVANQGGHLPTHYIIGEIGHPFGFIMNRNMNYRTHVLQLTKMYPNYSI